MSKLIVLHGWTYTAERWNKVVDSLASHGREVEIVPVPGLTAELSAPWTLDDYVEWLAKEIASERSVCLIGHSNGGRIALAFTLKYPEKVDRLILIDSAGIYPRGLRVSVKRTVFRAIAWVGKPLAASRFLRRALYALAGERDYRDANPVMRQTMSNLLSVDLAPLLRGVSRPTLIIWGALDKATPLSDALCMHERIKGSKLHVIADAGHSPHGTHWKEVAQLILDETSPA